MTRGFILGVDPGLSGAMALLDDDGQLIDVADAQGIKGVVSGGMFRTDLMDLCCDLPDSIEVAVIEFVASRPGQGVSSVFKFGQSFGVALGVLAGLKIRTETVTPAKWKRAMGLGKDKGASRMFAVERWPDRADLFKRMKDDGRAEAALIAAWWFDHIRVQAT